MGRGFRGEVASSGVIATNKEAVAERAANEGGVIWCVGRASAREKRYFLYQRIVDTRCRYARDADDFRVTLTGRTTLKRGFQKDITDEPYFPEVKKLLSLGLQSLGNRKILADFEAAYQANKTEE
ncbi:hypothetical protein [Deinococcus sedimenti]|uniref:Uncharacterized protein n=1 Tax=Deinococcus sedimenti TaxID=1867090 RepID=A0ABQ2S8P7_9DEIO|nr:hypothetical protein [Deinococcus sedimenti]GGS05610.1 hypothetical protein GCM10008960_35130 [Deinococcus sedimenti]